VGAPCRVRKGRNQTTAGIVIFLSPSPQTHAEDVVAKSGRVATLILWGKGTARILFRVASERVLGWIDRVFIGRRRPRRRFSYAFSRIMARFLQALSRVPTPSTYFQNTLSETSVPMPRSFAPGVIFAHFGPIKTNDPGEELRRREKQYSCIIVISRIIIRREP